MFFVLTRYVTDGIVEWKVRPHGKNGLKEPYKTREEAVKTATDCAMTNPNQFAVVELISVFERSVKTTVRRTKG